MNIYTPEQLARIRALNDEFRTTFRGGQIACTHSVWDMPEIVIASALLKASEFTDFNAGNDPFEEHDCVNFELCSRRFFFRISYLDVTMQQESPDPADPTVTVRLGVLMLANE